MSLFDRMSDKQKAAIMQTIADHELGDTLENAENPTTEDIRYVRLFQRLDLESKKTESKLQDFEKRIQSKIDDAIKADELTALQRKVTDLEAKYEDLLEKFNVMEVVTESLDAHNQHLSRFISHLQRRVSELTQNNLYLSVKTASDNRRYRRLNFRFYTSKRLTSDPSKLKNKVEFAKLMWQNGVCAAFGKGPSDDFSRYLAVGHALQENPNPRPASTKKGDKEFVRPAFRSIGVFASRSAAAEFWKNKDAISDFAKDNGFKASVGSDWDQSATAFLIKWGSHPKVRRVHLIDGVLYLRFNDSADRTFKVLNEFAPKLKDTLLPVKPVAVKNVPVPGVPPPYDDILAQTYNQSAHFSDHPEPPICGVHKVIPPLDDESEEETADDSQSGSESESEEEAVHTGRRGCSEAEDSEACEEAEQEGRLFYTQPYRQTRQGASNSMSASNSQPLPVRASKGKKKEDPQPNEEEQKGRSKSQKASSGKSKGSKKDKKGSPERQKTPDRKKKKE